MKIKSLSYEGEGYTDQPTQKHECSVGYTRAVANIDERPKQRWSRLVFSIVVLRCGR